MQKKKNGFQKKKNFGEQSGRKFSTFCFIVENFVQF